MNKIYKGRRAGATAVHEATVTVHPETGDSYSLPWRLDLRNHSPTGLNWGYGGSGPAQCSLAILADHLGDDRKALGFCQAFKWEVIARLPIGAAWELTSAQIDEALAALRANMMSERGAMDLAEWAKLRKHLEGVIGCRIPFFPAGKAEDGLVPCDGTLRHTLAWLTTEYGPGQRLDDTIGWIRAQGGYCDCEVLMNVPD